MQRVRWFPLAVAIGLVSPSISEGQSADATTKQIAALEENWITAVIKRDAMAFNRLLAPDFIYTEDDRVYTKTALIREVTQSTDTVTRGRNEDLRIRVYGDAAVATGWLVLEGRNAKGPFTVRYRYTDTWMRFGGRWRVVAAHDYKKP